MTVSSRRLWTRILAQPALRAAFYRTVLMTLYATGVRKTSHLLMKVLNDNGRYRALFVGLCKTPVPSLGREVGDPDLWH